MKDKSICILCISLTLTPLQVGSTSEATGKQTHTRTFETCYSPLSTADTDNDGKLSQKEYAQFVIASSDGGIESAEQYNDLAFELQVTYVYLDCLCGSSESGNCCDGYIDIAGSNANDSPTDQELAYLDEICSKTQSALEELLPSSSTTTNSPTMKLTAVAPSYFPMTAEPSLKPSTSNEPPSGSPVISPISLSPSARPSTKPTVIETEAPTVYPTVSPVQTPTSSPSTHPTTISPSLNPSSSPTNITSTSEPSLNPSTSPVKIPTIRPAEIPTTLSSSLNPSLSPSLRLTDAPTHVPVWDQTVPPATLQSFDSPTPSPSLQMETSSLLPSKRPSTLSNTTITPSLTTDEQMLSMTEVPTIADEYLDRPSNAPSTDNGAAVDTDVDNIEKGGKEHTDGPSAGVILGVLFPVIAIIAVVILAIGIAIRRKKTEARLSSLDDDAKNGLDEEVGASRNTDASNDEPGILGDSSLGVAIMKVKTTSEAEPNLGGSTLVTPELGIISKNEVDVMSVEELSVRDSAADVDSSDNRVQMEEVHPPSSGTRLVTASAAKQEVLSATDEIDISEHQAFGEAAAPLAQESEIKAESSQNTETKTSASPYASSKMRNISTSEIVVAADSHETAISDKSIDPECNIGFARRNTATTSNVSSSANAVFSGNIQSTTDSDDERATIESLIIRVMPKEKDNVDNMMRDFRGKEGELISMLELMEGQKSANALAAASTKTMNAESNLMRAIERGDWHSVGQAAAIMRRKFNNNESTDENLDRKQHAVYLEKEERIKQFEDLIDRGDWVGIVTVAGQYQALNKDIDSDNESEHNIMSTVPGTSASLSLSSNDSDAEVNPQAQTFLKAAIERGDWHAVGQAAAIIGKDFMPKCTDSAGSVSSAGTYNSQQTLYLEKEDRIKHLDAMIAQGDWIGIVIAAGQYQAMDEDLDFMM